MDPEMLAKLIDAGGELFTIALLLLGMLAVRKWALKGERARLIAMGVEFAYGAVNELARRTATRIDDKAAEGLKKLAAYLAAQGAEPPTPEEVAQARAAFEARHGHESKVLGVVAAASPH